jgi:hypothetical protein
MPDGTVSIYLRVEEHGGRTWVARVSGSGHGAAVFMNLERAVGHGRAGLKFTLTEGEVYLLKESWGVPYFVTVRGGVVIPLSRVEVEAQLGSALEDPGTPEFEAT